MAQFKNTTITGTLVVSGEVTLEQAAANPFDPVRYQEFMEAIAGAGGSQKDVSGGVAGLTLFAIDTFNTGGTIKSSITNANTGSRVYTFQDRNGTIADQTDIANAENRANHTGTQLLSTISNAGTAAAAALDTDGAMAADSTTRVPSQSAVVTFVTNKLGLALQAANNLSDLANAATARGNLGLGTAATETLSTDGAMVADSDSNVPSQKATVTFVTNKLALALQAANNLSDLANAATARGNLGLGTAATQASTAFDAAGAAAAVSAGLGTAAAATLDTDGTMAADSAARVPSQSAVVTYVSNKVAGLLNLKGALNCGANPNYPAGALGDSYYVSVAGDIGGGSGLAVQVGDLVVCETANAGGTQASVGADWFILQHNLNGALLASNNLSDLANGATARTNLGLGTAATQPSTAFDASGAATTAAAACLAKANNLSDLANAATARGHLGLGTAATQNSTAFDAAGAAAAVSAGLGSAATLNISTDETLGGGSDSDTLIPSQKAVKTYVDAHSGGGGSLPFTIGASSPIINSSADGYSKISLDANNNPLIQGGPSNSGGFYSFDSSNNPFIGANGNGAGFGFDSNFNPQILGIYGFPKFSIDANSNPLIQAGVSNSAGFFSFTSNGNPFIGTNRNSAAGFGFDSNNNPYIYSSDSGVGFGFNSSGNPYVCCGSDSGVGFGFDSSDNPYVINSSGGTCGFTFAGSDGNPQMFGSDSGVGFCFSGGTAVITQGNGYVSIAGDAGGGGSPALYSLWWNSNGNVGGYIAFQNQGEGGTSIGGAIDGSDAAAGTFGEIISASVSSGSPVSLTSGTAANLTSISLTAGDWDVTGAVDFHANTGTTTTYMQGSISGTSATMGEQDSGFSLPVAIATNAVDVSQSLPVVRMSLESTTTIYLVAKAGFATSTLGAYGTIRARRVR